jgi:uncharacterized protein (TIGR02246 family)
MAEVDRGGQLGTDDPEHPSPQRNDPRRSVKAADRIDPLAHLKEAGLWTLGLMGFFVVPLPSAETGSRTSDPKRDIEALLYQRLAAWNRGDLGKFMEAYSRSPNLVIVRNATALRGWDAVLDQFARVLDSAAERQIGILESAHEQIAILGSDAALVTGAYRATASGGTHQRAFYTFVMRRLSEGWRIICDHTSFELRREER